MQINSIGNIGAESMALKKMMEEMRAKLLKRLDQNEAGQAEINSAADPAGPPVEDLIKSFDTNQDGVLDQRETLDLLNAMEQARMAQMQKRMLDQLDQNGDGSIEADELAGLAEQTGQAVDTLLEEYDTNHDGVLDATEAARLAQEMRPPPPPPQPAEAGADAADQSGDTLQSLLEALKNSANDQTTQTLMARYTQLLIQTYITNNEGGPLPGNLAQLADE